MGKMRILWRRFVASLRREPYVALYRRETAGRHPARAKYTRVG